MVKRINFRKFKEIMAALAAQQKLAKKIQQFRVLKSVNAEWIMNGLEIVLDILTKEWPTIIILRAIEACAEIFKLENPPLTALSIASRMIVAIFGKHNDLKPCIQMLRKHVSFVLF